MPSTFVGIYLNFKLTPNKNFSKYLIIPTYILTSREKLEKENFNKVMEKEVRDFCENFKTIFEKFCLKRKFLKNIVLK